MSFHARTVALELVKACAPVAKAIARHDRAMASQLRRASTGVLANTAEGARRAGGDRLHSFRIAGGEAAETRCWLEAAVAYDHVAASAVADALALADRACALLWRLVHPRR